MSTYRHACVSTVWQPKLRCVSIKNDDSRKQSDLDDTYDLIVKVMANNDGKISRYFTEIW